MATPLAARAETPSVTPEYETVVTADRVGKDRFEAARSIEVMDREGMDEAQAASVPEVLEEIPGVHMQRTNGGAGSPYLRGLTGPDNLILVDGIRFNTSIHRTGPNQYLNMVPAFALERVEVLRGPSSLLYGDGAMGGVVHLVTRHARPDGGDAVLSGQVKGWFQGASLGAGGSAVVETTWRDLGVVVGSGYSEFQDLRAGGGELQPLSSYRAVGAFTRVSYRPAPRWRLDAGYLFSGVLDAGRADGITIGDTRFYDNHDHLAHVRARWSGTGILRRFNAVVAWHRTWEGVERNTCATTGGLTSDLGLCEAQAASAITRKRAYEDLTDTVGTSLDATLGFFEDRWLVSLGLDLYQDFIGSGLKDTKESKGFTLEDQPRGNFSDGSRYLSLGAFVRTEVLIWDFGRETGRLVASGGARVSHFRAFAPDVPGWGDIEHHHTGVVGSAALQFVRNHRYNVYFSFDQGFRAPNLQETTVLADTGDRFEIPNGDLGPVRSDTFEVGARFRIEPLAFSVAGFLSLLDDVIDTAPTTWNGQALVEGRPVTRMVNSDSARIWGVEGGLSARVWRLTFGTHLTWTHGTIEKADGTRYPVRRIPPLFGTFSARYDHPDRSFFAELFLRGAGPQDRLHPSDRKDLRICGDPDNPGKLLEDCEGTPAWVTLNLRAGWRIGDHFTLEAALLNVVDTRYRVHASGLDAPGFDARISLKVDY